MNLKLKRITGFLLIIGAAAGFVFSIIGLVEIWRYQPSVTQSVVDTLALFDQTVETTQKALTVAGEVVQIATEDVASLQTTIQALAQTIHSTNPMLDSLTTLTSKDLPAAVDATQTSLASAQNSAQLIDNVLGALTSIPFLPVAAYKPEVPLHTALDKVSSSLDPLTPALAAISASLTDGKTTLGVVEDELNKISETTVGISSTLVGAKTVIDQYIAVTAQLKAKVEAAKLAAPTWMRTIAWILTFALVWSLIAQIGLCTQGLDMLWGRIGSTAA